MRCNSCGEINAPSATTCKNCGAVLNKNGDEEQVRRTVVQSISKCPKCGYSVLSDFKTCPNCGAAIQPKQSAPHTVVSNVSPRFGTTACIKCGKEVSNEYLFCPYCSSPIPKMTIPVGKHRNKKEAEANNEKEEKNVPLCSLTLIPDEGEQKAELHHEFEGESIVLNRSNTEPDNLTITSKEQAILTNEDGRWFVLNHSELGSTFVEANRKLELQSGDIIILGDRRFRFEIRKQQ